MNYTLILKTKHGTYTENLGDIFYFRKEQKIGRIILENVLQNCMEILLSTQAHYFDFGFVGI